MAAKRRSPSPGRGKIRCYNCDKPVNILSGLAPIRLSQYDAHLYELPECDTRAGQSLRPPRQFGIIVP